jgi:hypothetical protein
MQKAVESGISAAQFQQNFVPFPRRTPQWTQIAAFLSSMAEQCLQ